MVNSKGVVLITGSAAGIGRASALKLASDGFDLALNDLPNQKDALENLAKEIQGLGRRACILPGDVTDEETVKGVVASTVQELGSLDVMIANAGMFMAPIPLNKIDQPLWDKIFSVNVRSVFFCFKHASDQMIAQGRGGRLIAATSLAGRRAFSNMSAYSASKFAVRGLCEAAALDFGKYGITANSYAPGAIATQMTGLDTNPELKAAMETKSALGRTGTPEDVAGVVAFLASEESKYVSGQCIGCDGAWIS